jgi:Gpi18-like mannosyltransferase
MGYNLVMARKSTSILTILAIGLCVRLFFSTLPAFKIDMDAWIGWGEQMYSVGPSYFYSSGIWTDYTPGYLYFLWLVSSVQHVLFAAPTRGLTEFLYKLVPLIFDTLSGYIIYRILNHIFTAYSTVLRNGTRTAALFALIYLLTPLTFFNSSTWGQADSVPTFFPAPFVLSLHHAYL